MKENPSDNGRTETLELAQEIRLKMQGEFPDANVVAIDKAIGDAMLAAGDARKRAEIEERTRELLEDSQ